ncbi:uncharacterized protein PV09_08922 [Verruconis gallopava]|uniref:Small ribosomal subunit protein mS37 n=1 Tax=Verruconis gallopava TaxID=253628 RepID=A0A0D1ZY25_9PEZI|nr:uncharacterized protein PV09_08922 [Verruconis gallopava]KIV99377.1 hypothetical protein PV09_08922 [Verruconis gallopava]
MVPKPPGSSAVSIQKAPRLPPLPRLKVKKPNKTLESPCMGIMSSVLGCWASSGQGAKACAVLEQQLRICMDQKATTKPQGNNINYHLQRFYSRVVGPEKKKK